MSGHFKVSRDVWDSAAFSTNEPMSEREAWIWLECRCAGGTEFSVSRFHAEREIGWEWARAKQTLFRWSEFGLVSALQVDDRVICGSINRRFLSGDVRPISPRFYGQPKAPEKRAQIPSATRRKVLARGVCVYCGDTQGPFHVDHVKPLARGGSNAESNLACSCASCNMAKGAKTLQEWRGVQ